MQPFFNTFSFILFMFLNFCPDCRFIFIFVSLDRSGNFSISFMCTDFSFLPSSYQITDKETI